MVKHRKTDLFVSLCMIAYIFIMQLMRVILGKATFMIMLAVLVCLVTVYMIVYREPISSIGFNKKKVPIFFSIGVFVLILIISVALSRFDLIGFWFDNLIFVGIIEEVLFIGFLIPRINQWVKNKLITVVILGLLVGALYYIPIGITHGFDLFKLYSTLCTCTFVYCIYAGTYLYSGSILYALMIHSTLLTVGYI